MKAIVLAILLGAGVAYAAPITTPLPATGFCTVNPGSYRSSVVCDYPLYPHPRRYAGRQGLRVRVLLYLQRRGGLTCRVWDVYDPAIGSIRDGRIVDTDTVCY